MIRDERSTTLRIYIRFPYFIILLCTLIFFTKLQSSFDLVQTGFPLSFITESSPNSGEHFGLPGLYQQGIVVLLHNQTHVGVESTINIVRIEEIETHSWYIIIVLIVTLIIRNRRGVRVRPRGDQVLIAQLHFVMTGQITVVFCKSRKRRIR